jgi:hypothetical protein
VPSKTRRYHSGLFVTRAGPTKSGSAPGVLDGEIAIRHAAAGYGLAVITVDGDINPAHVDKADRDCKLSQAEEQHERAEARHQQA